MGAYKEAVKMAKTYRTDYHVRVRITWAKGPVTVSSTSRET